MKGKFQDEFRELFGIDITEDNPSVHPAQVCNAHNSLMYKFRQAMKRGQTYSTDVQVRTFEPHSETNCAICKNAPAGDHSYMPSTRRGGPGRGIRGSHVVVEPNEKSEVDSLLSQITLLSTEDRVQFWEKAAKAMSTTERNSLAATLGALEKEKLKAKISGIKHIYHSINNLEDLEIAKYVASQDSVILQSVFGLCSLGMDDVKASSNLACRVALMIEHVYQLLAPSFIGPMSFLQNINIFAFTHSKIAANMLGTTEPAGKYMCVSNWLQQQAAVAPLCPPGDIVCVFDNEQLVGRTWNVTPNNKVKVSVITNVIAVALSEETKYQNDDTLHPRMWFRTARNEDKITRLCMESSSNDGEEDLEESSACTPEEMKRVHWIQLSQFLDAAIQEAVVEQQQQQREASTSTEYSDVIDRLVEEAHLKKEFIKCAHCETLNIKTKRKCQECNQSLRGKHQENCLEKDDKYVAMKPITEQGHVMREVNPITIYYKKQGKQKTYEMPMLGCRTAVERDRYDHIPSGHPDHPIPVTMLDPVLVNPNSYDSVILVLRKIGQDAGVTRYGGGQRRWLIVCCDGLPYGLVLKLIQDYLVCMLCQKGFLTLGDFKLHTKSVHPDVEDVPFMREFDWVLPVIGDGHYEMTLVKAFTELNWDVFMSVLVKRNGWLSEMALMCAKKCSDTHKAWQLLLVFYFGTLQELVIPYVRTCLAEKLEPTARGFMTFSQKQCQEPNFRYMFDMVCRYAQAVLNFHMGIRRNNHALVQSARYMTKELFHGRSHPKYQQTEITVAFLDVISPPELKQFLHHHQSVSVSGDPSKGQGYDFILEEENRKVKRWIKGGVPTDQTWLSVCRNKDRLEGLRRKLFDMLEGCDSIPEMKTATRFLKLEEAIQDWRVCLRESGYLTDKSILHKSLTGSQLDAGLVNFTESADRKRSYRMLELLLNQPPPDDSDLPHPVYVTPCERETHCSIGKQTTATIDNQILDIIQELTELEEMQYLDRFRKDIIKSPKQAHINFLQELKQLPRDYDLHSAEDTTD